MKKLIMCLILSLLGCLSIALAQNNANRTISVKGYGTVNVFPNAATITLNIKFVRPTLREAINETQKTEKEVFKIIKKYVADSNEIMKGFISTDKSHEYNNKLGKYVFTGFESQQSIVFPLNDLNRMEKLTEEILKTKIQEITSVTYFNTNAATYFKQAQEIAVKEALESTKRVATVSGVKLGHIVSIHTGASPNSAENNVIETNSFHAYGKSMGGKGVSSSGQLITFSAAISMETALIE